MVSESMCGVGFAIISEKGQLAKIATCEAACMLLRQYQVHSGPCSMMWSLVEIADDELLLLTTQTFLQIFL